MLFWLDLVRNTCCSPHLSWPVWGKWSRPCETVHSTANINWDINLFSNRRNSSRKIDPSIQFLILFKTLNKYIFKVLHFNRQKINSVQTSNTSEEMFEYYVNTVQIMDMMRDAIVKLRATMKDVIRTELYAVDREYIVGIGVLSILVIISPMMIYLVRNAVTSLQIFSTSVRLKAAALKREKKRAEGLM